MRLDAESLRDAILAVSGQLNRQFGGAPYQDFTSFVKNSQFYTMIDPVGRQFNRRTIYRTWLRSGRNRFLDAFDCPDPSATAPRRAVTTTPTQSLSLLNNSFVLRMSQHLAELAKSDGENTVVTQVTRVFECAYARPPQDDELSIAIELVEQHGLASLCRVIFNSNEFLYVD